MSFLNNIRNFKNFFNNSSHAFSTEEAIRNYDFIEWRSCGGDTDIFINLSDLSGVTEAYSRCSTLSTIINRNSLSLVNGKWWIVDKKDNDISGKYKSLTALLSKPNPLQSWSELISQMDVYRQLYGEAFLFAVVPAGFSIQEASALWVINPRYIDIEVTGKMYMQSNLDDIISEYYLNVEGYRTRLDKQYILHIKDTNQNVLMSPHDVRGKSRLEGLGNSIRNIIQAEEAVYALNKDRGAQGILSNETKDAAGSVPLSDKEKERLQKEFKARYGIKTHQAKVIISDSNLKWQTMSFNVRDLMLFEGIESNIQRLADAFDYPYELLSHGSGVTYANKLEAKRFHYQDNTIPISKIYAEKFTDFFQLEKASFVIDFSDVECLKKTETDKAETLYKLNQANKVAKEAGVISTAEWRLSVGMDEEIYKPDKQSKNNTNDDNKIEGENTTEEVSK